MAVNISRGKYQNLYSSDRISSLIGNGLLVFINKNTNFQKILSKKDVIFYKNKKDLIKKLDYYNTNHKQSIKIAKSGHEKYHKHMNNLVISNYILKSVGLLNIKNPIWHNKI
jgi:spore maturation protein CgeB